MALRCPRCPDAALAERRVAAAEGSAVAGVHHCAACKGLWVDHAALTAVCLTLAHLPDHRGEVALLGKAGQGIATCPRCEVAPYEFTVLDRAIDFCTRCAGVWLDGDEYEEAQLKKAEAAAAQVERGGGPYRRAARAVRAAEMTCAYCKTPITVERSYMHEGGLACARCHFSEEQRTTESRASNAKVTIGPLLVGAVIILDALVELSR